MNNLIELDKVIENPNNYAAIYARISGKYDNNSIDSQIQLATNALKNKDLLVYKVYKDLDSAKRLSPTERKGLSRLLADAKAGCFKTVIIYRLDRLVRRYKDWLEIKNTFSKLGIKLIYSDESQSFPSNSAQGSFFENLMVMVAEMEPDTISQRASNGRKFMRKQGYYSPGNNILFGYIKNKKDSSYSLKPSNSIFVKEPVKLAFIKFIYRTFNEFISKEISTSKIIPNKLSSLSNILNEVIENTSSNISKGELSLDDLDNSSPTYELFSTLNSCLKDIPKEKIIQDINEVKYKFLFNKERQERINTNNLAYCLNNSVYAGYMLEDAKNPHKGIKNSLNEKDEVIYYKELDITAFIKIKNLNEVIPYDIFESVYTYITYNSLINKDRSPNFLLKGTLKCSCNKCLYINEDNYLHCGNNSCTAFIKDDLLGFIVNEIVKDCLSNSTTAIDKFQKELLKKTKTDSQNIKYLKKKNFESLSNYLNSKDESFIDSIYSKKSSIDSYTSLCSQYRQKINSINLLFDKINNSKDSLDIDDNKSSTPISDVSKKVTEYILANEDIFIPMFSEIIKEVKVKINNESNSEKGNITIKYSFTPERNSNLH